MASDPKDVAAAQCKADPEVRGLRDLSGAIAQAATANGPLTPHQRTAVETTQAFTKEQLSSMQAQRSGGKPNEAEALFNAVDNELARALASGNFKPSRDVATGMAVIASEISNAADFAEMNCTASARSNLLKDSRSGGRT